MFTAIVRFSIKKKLFVGLTTLFLFIGGIYAMLTLPIDAVPDITNNQVQIVTVSPTLAPQEVEQLITMPIEIAMSNIMYLQPIITQYFIDNKSEIWLLFLIAHSKR